jgi:hypothetical protein
LRQAIALCTEGVDNFPGAAGACAAMRRELGEILLHQGHYSDAEPLLLAAYEDLKSRNGKWPLQDCRKTIENLITLYQATPRPAELARWDAILADFKTAHPEP